MITNNVSGENATCPAVGYQAVNVNVPVTVTPFAQTGSTVTSCCGAPTVTAGISTTGIKNGACTFTIGQNLVVAIPVAFGAQATTGDAYVDCIGAAAEEITCDALSQMVQPPTEPTTPTV
ncbi:MAG: hypothetical protein ACRCW1_09050 [Anaerotignaceae bacterium]